MSPFAGRTVRLQLESHPGPKNNTGWDQSYWAEPLLVAGVVVVAVEGGGTGRVRVAVLIEPPNTGVPAVTSDDG